jgi:multiple RNA-binding domain-containing protein 1
VDFLKSKIRKNWSDSESDDEDSGDQLGSSSDDEEPSNELLDANEGGKVVDQKGNLDLKNHVDKKAPMEVSDMEEVEDPDNQDGEHIDTQQKDEKHASQEKEDVEAASATDEKKLALETGRLYICNLSYATTYVLTCYYFRSTFMYYIQDITVYLFLQAYCCLWFQ